jgi:predicted site-specific integrase-resolvase
MIEKYYTTAQISADILVGCDREVLTRKCRRGEIKGAVKVGKDWRIPESTLKEMLRIAA